MSDEITLRDIYEQQLRTQADVAATRADMAGLRAGVTSDLAHGSKKMDGLDERMRQLEQRMPEHLGERLTSLERDRDKDSGASTAVRWLVTTVIAVAGGGIGTALIQAIHH